MAKKPTAAAASTAILVATVQLKGGGVTVDAGAELTPALLKEMGFDKKTDDHDGPAELARLTERGFIKSTTVRTAEPAPEATEFKAALARADAAEQKAEALQQQVDDLTAQLAAAKQPA